MKMKRHRSGDNSKARAIKNITFKRLKIKKSHSLSKYSLLAFFFFRISDVRIGLFLFMLHFVFKSIIHFLPIDASAAVKATVISVKSTAAIL